MAGMCGHAVEPHTLGVGIFHEPGKCVGFGVAVGCEYPDIFVELPVVALLYPREQPAPNGDVL